MDVDLGDMLYVAVYALVFLVVCVAAVVAMVRRMRRRKEFNRALDLVVESIVNLEFDEQAMAEKNRFARARNFILDAITQGPKGNVAVARRSADRRHWLQLQVDHLLRKQWGAFQFECDVRDTARKNLRNLTAQKLGSMTNSAVDKLHSDLALAKARLESEQGAFHDLQAAVATIGLRVWDGGSFYMLLDPDETYTYAAQSTATDDYRSES